MLKGAAQRQGGFCGIDGRFFFLFQLIASLTGENFLIAYYYVSFILVLVDSSFWQERVGGVLSNHSFLFNIQLLPPSSQ